MSIRSIPHKHAQIIHVSAAAEGISPPYVSHLPLMADSGAKTRRELVLKRLSLHCTLHCVMSTKLGFLHYFC